MSEPNVLRTLIRKRDDIENVIKDGKIVVPPERKVAKELLRFLDDAICEAPISARRYLTNSKRPY